MRLSARALASGHVAVEDAATASKLARTFVMQIDTLSYVGSEKDTSGDQVLAYCIAMDGAWHQTGFMANRQTPVTNRRYHCPATGTPNHREFRGSIGRNGSKGSEMISDAAYFTIRADEERSAAMNASQTIARQTHLELANRYQVMADAIIEAGGLRLDDVLAA